MFGSAPSSWSVFNREIDRHHSRYEYLHKCAFNLQKISALTRSASVLEHDGCVNTATWSDTGELLYTGSDDRTIKVWQVSTPTNVLLKHTVETRHRGNIF